MDWKIPQTSDNTPAIIEKEKKVMASFARDVLRYSQSLRITRKSNYNKNKHGKAGPGMVVSEEVREEFSYKDAPASNICR